MEKTWETENRSISLVVSIKCEGKCRFRIIASAPEVNSKYADRTVEVSGYRQIYLSFPTSPKQTKIVVKPLDKTANYLVDIKEKALKTYQIYQDAEVKKFVAMAQNFTAQCGTAAATPQGRFFRSKDGYFNFRYFPFIIDGGKISSTPARIGHQSGIIEISKMHFDKYTIPMRMIILLHEFSHKYRNPKIDLDISNEVGADLNALYIYLGLGYSKVDAIYCFANVFLKAQSQGNLDRMRKIMDYINRFENQEFAKILTE